MRSPFLFSRFLNRAGPWLQSLWPRLLAEPVILFEIEQNPESSRLDILATVMNQRFYCLDRGPGLRK